MPPMFTVSSSTPHALWHGCLRHSMPNKIRLHSITQLAVAQSAIAVAGRPASTVSVNCAHASPRAMTLPTAPCCWPHSHIFGSPNSALTHMVSNTPRCQGDAHMSNS
eukprot:3933792-Rhodomonas_salina.1